MTQQWKPEDTGDDVQMPLNTGGGEAPAEEYSAPGKPRINTSTLALVAAFAAGLVLIYLLGLHNKPRAASASDTAHEVELENKFKNFMGNTTDLANVESALKDSRKFKKMIEDYFKVKPFNQDQVINPFARDLPPEPIFSQGATTQVAPIGPIEDPVLAREMREAADYFPTLKLQMVMLGKPSMAMINNRMVSSGTRLNMFTVGDINEDSVSLVFKDKTFVLKSTSPGNR
jgi:hypothetical protein